ncbi:alpha/beta fold hydrolase [Brachybacterium sp. GCM10030267]|uniref:alpha/beta fold hydrolase n=1 Tax=Brachybacterium sp. GCM10030267 TaxID=3273381 RepID=UPI00360A48FE
MATFVLLHGAGDVGWSWHLVEAELRARGHDVVAPDLPCEDEAAGHRETADAVIGAVGDRQDVVVVGHSFGGFTAPLVASRMPARVRGLVYLAAMIPAPGERAGDWWSNTGYSRAVESQAARDGGVTGHEDPFVSFFHGVPDELAQEAMRRSRGQSGRSFEDPWPLEEHPHVPTRFLLCREDRFFPADFLRRLARARLGVEAEEVPGGHCVALSHPRELADALETSLS